MTAKDPIKCATKCMKALANQHRLAILCHLEAGERNVTELEESVGISQSALSQHLCKLRGEGLVKTRRDKQTIFYSINNELVAKIMGVLHAHFGCGAGGESNNSI